MTSGCSKPPRLRAGSRENRLYLGWVLRVGVVVFALALRSMSADMDSLVFPEGRVLEIQIDLDEASKESLRRYPRRDVVATVQSEGKLYREVQIHLKGSTGSFRSLDDKPGFTVEFSSRAPNNLFHGCQKIHLNNAVEDPSYLSEWLGREMFAEAGVPLPAVSHALVWLGQRRLGLYVLKEGWVDYLRRHDPSGSRVHILEPEPGSDPVGSNLAVRHPWRVSSQVRDLLQDFRTTLNAEEPPKRSSRLEQIVDIPSIQRFLALEVLLGHRDGYLLAGNNYRIRVDAVQGRLDLLPHGMDQLLQPPDLIWNPQPSGRLASVLLGTPEGMALHETLSRQLFHQILDQERWGFALRSKAHQLAMALPAVEARALRQGGEELEHRWASRVASLRQQFSQVLVPRWDVSESQRFLSGWNLKTNSIQTAVEGRERVEGGKYLHLHAQDGPLGSWYTKISLPRGRYRFEGKVQTEAVAALPFGHQQGARLRVSGDRPPSLGCLGNSKWCPLELDFDVTQSREEVQLFCELRASAGHALFDTSSLRLRRLR